MSVFLREESRHGLNRFTQLNRVMGEEVLNADLSVGILSDIADIVSRMIVLLRPYQRQASLPDAQANDLGPPTKAELNRHLVEKVLPEMDLKYTVFLRNLGRQRLYVATATKAMPIPPGQKRFGIGVDEEKAVQQLMARLNNAEIGETDGIAGPQIRKEMWEAEKNLTKALWAAVRIVLSNQSHPDGETSDAHLLKLVAHLQRTTDTVLKLLQNEAV